MDLSVLNSSPLVSCTLAGAVAVVRLQDEAGKNALSHHTTPEIERVFLSLAGRDELNAVVLAGLPDYFCTGASRAVLDSLAAGSVAPRDLLLPRALLALDVPLIAAVEGHALGGGLALALCADICVAARESRYGCTFINYGFTPGMGVTGLLEYSFGPALAHEMLLTGERLRGSRFQGCPGFNYLLPRHEVMPKALHLAACLAEKSRPALSALKTSLSSRKREIFEAARTREVLMHQLTFSRETVAAALRDEFPS